MEELDSINLADWPEIYENSSMSVGVISAISKIGEGLIRSYLNGFSRPREKNFNKMVIAMHAAKNSKRIQFHPSYGYATQEQIEKLKSLKIGVDMDQLLKEIEGQTRSRGKIK